VTTPAQPQDPSAVRAVQAVRDALRIEQARLEVLVREHGTDLIPEHLLSPGGGLNIFLVVADSLSRVAAHIEADLQ
jgi:hypothetical protein